ncbi:MAG: hypothetical protein ABL971_10985 [Vicinamibacterales bacterium]
MTRLTLTNLYTIVPLRAANARTLVEQRIGRGLRLPYGRRTGVTALDRLSIVAHDRFQEIVDDANRDDSPLKVVAVEMSGEELQERLVTVVSQSLVAEQLGLAEPSGLGTAAGTEASASGSDTPGAPAPWRPAGPEECRVVETTMAVIQSLSARPDVVPGVSYLNRPDVQARVVREVNERMAGQLTLTDITGIDLSRSCPGCAASWPRALWTSPRSSCSPSGG